MPKNEQGKLEIRRPTESEIASTTLQGTASSDGGNVQIHGPTLFGSLNDNEKILPEQVKEDSALLNGDVQRFPAFDQ